MSEAFAHAYIEGRRLFLLRFLAELAEANEDTLVSAARGGGFRQSARADISFDLDHLRDHGALKEEWVGPLRVLSLTPRGEDAAHGRIAIEGVEHSIWRRA